MRYISKSGIDYLMIMLSNNHLTKYTLFDDNSFSIVIFCNKSFSIILIIWCLFDDYSFSMVISANLADDYSF